MSAPARQPGSMRVLVVDDEKNIRTTLAVCLEQAGCAVVAVPSAAAALAALGRQPFDLALVDLRLGAESGLDLIPRLLETDRELGIVVVTAYATIETAVEAVRRGARDYLAKPFVPSQIRHLVERERERRSLAGRLADLQERLAVAAPEADLASASARMSAVLETVARAADSDASVLIRGESGTGKGVLARALHDRSARRERPFVVVNCPALEGDLLTSDLFGHARGAFTGAVRDRIGRVEAAEGGTLFLDEIAELGTGAQSKLLRLLQERTFERVGETETRRADVRLVAATNRDLEADVRSGRFREDLYYRINVIDVVLPPLRDRSEDVLRLAERFLAFFSRAAKRRTLEISPGAQEALLRYAWPGNVRELRNVIERVSVLWPTDVVELEALPERMHASDGERPQIGGPFTLETIERAHIQGVLAIAKSVEEAARTLAIDPSTLWRKKKRLDEG